MTMPSELYGIAYQNQTKVYNILFKTVAETLEELAELKEKERRDEISGLNGARREGIKEGERKNRLEVAKKM